MFGGKQATVICELVDSSQATSTSRQPRCTEVGVAKGEELGESAVVTRLQPSFCQETEVQLVRVDEIIHDKRLI